MNQNQRQNGYPPQGFEQEVSLTDYWHILKRRKSAVLKIFFVSLISVTIVTNAMAPVYQATVTLFIDQEGSNVLTISGNNMALAGQNYATYKEYFLSQKGESSWYLTGKAIIEGVFCIHYSTQKLKIFFLE